MVPRAAAQCQPNSSLQAPVSKTDFASPANPNSSQACQTKLKLESTRPQRTVPTKCKHPESADTLVLSASCRSMSRSKRSALSHHVYIRRGSLSLVRSQCTSMVQTGYSPAPHKPIHRCISSCRLFNLQAAMAHHTMVLQILIISIQSNR